MKGLLLNSVVSFMGSPQGPARLYGHARRQGLPLDFLNLNHDVYSYFLSERALSERLQEARPRLFWSLSRDTAFRRSFGSILLHSSAGELPRMAAAIEGDRRLPFLRPSEDPHSGGVTGRMIRNWASRSVARVAATRINTNNLPFVLLGNIEEFARRIGEAQKRMDAGFLRLPAEEFLSLYRTLLCGKAIMDALYYPAQLDLGLGFQGTEWAPTAEEAIRATGDGRHNYMIRYYQEAVMPRIRATAPGWLGISVTHLSEFIPALTLASLVKAENDGIHITLGGAAVSDIRFRLAGNPTLWTNLDSVVHGPGELAMEELLSRLDSGADLAGVPNLIYREGTAIRFSDKTAELAPDDWATPEYVNLRPGAGVGLETSTSCYWGKCAFCYYPRIGNAARDFVAMPSRERALERVFDDMRTLAQRHDPYCIGFTDSAIPPSRLAAIAEHNRRQRPITPFSTFIRLEKEFASPSLGRLLAQSGFMGGQAGLEAGTARVNALINKGIDFARVPDIIRNFHRHGLLLHLYSIVGFPGETQAEARETLRFFKRHHRKLGLDWQIYPLRVLENGPLAEHPDSHGLRSVEKLPPNLIVAICKYEVKEGLTMPEANRLAVTFELALARRRKTVSRWMDVEAYKLFLIKQSADAFRDRQAEDIHPERGALAPLSIVRPNRLVQVSPVPIAR